MAERLRNIMNNFALFATWMLVIGVAVVFGGICQYGLFKTTENTLREALLTHPFLWLFYILVSLALGERIFRKLKQNT
jgi:hypothetical protein